MIDLIVMVLATHRALGLWFGQTILAYPRAWLTKLKLGALVNCPICMSVWVGSGVATLWWLGGFWGQLWVWGIALSGAAELVQVWSTRYPPQAQVHKTGDNGRLEALESTVSAIREAMKVR
jgi:hypothetical protein